MPLYIQWLAIMPAPNVGILSFKYVDNSTMESKSYLSSIKSNLFDSVFTFLGVALPVVSELLIRVGIAGP